MLEPAIRAVPLLWKEPLMVKVPVGPPAKGCMAFATATVPALVTSPATAP